jgi:hypothetical protein
MSLRYFTVVEANRLLPELKPLVGELLERRARASQAGREMRELLGDLSSNVGGRHASELALEFVEIERLISQIQAYGCVIKSLEAGLVDFLSERDGRDVFLCWRYGEPNVAYYHELHTGYQSRRPLD